MRAGAVELRGRSRAVSHEENPGCGCEAPCGEKRHRGQNVCAHSWSELADPVAVDAQFNNLSCRARRAEFDRVEGCEDPSLAHRPDQRGEYREMGVGAVDLE